MIHLCLTSKEWQIHVWTWLPILSNIGAGWLGTNRNWQGAEATQNSLSLTHRHIDTQTHMHRLPAKLFSNSPTEYEGTLSVCVSVEPQGHPVQPSPSYPHKWLYTPLRSLRVAWDVIPFQINFQNGCPGRREDKPTSRCYCLAKSSRVQSALQSGGVLLIGLLAELLLVVKLKAFL